MEMGPAYVGQTFYDALGNCPEQVLIDEDGWGEFHTDGGSVA